MFITRAYVEKVETPYLIRVRIPFLNRAKESSNCTPTRELATAPICVPTNFIPNIQAGDVVFVGFEDNDYGKPVILGMLYRKEMGQSRGTALLSSLDVQVDTHLSEETSIGEVTAENIRALIGCNNNLQAEITALKDMLAKCNNEIENLKRRVTEVGTSNLLG